jgi:hypothetical protein
MRPAGGLVVAAAALGFVPSSIGAWSVGPAGSGYAGAKSMSASVGNVPTGTVSSHSVTLSWTVSQFNGGGNVPSYVVKRYDGATNALQATLSACSGNVASTGCTENSVPTGSWKYTITPAAGTQWRGTESAKSAAVVVLI